MIIADLIEMCDLVWCRIGCDSAVCGHSNEVFNRSYGSLFAQHVLLHCIFLWRNSPMRAFSFLRFLDRTEYHTTVNRTPLDE
jgi:hypothetical protein